MRIKLATPLIGEFPRYANVKLPDNAAVIAQNMRLDSSDTGYIDEFPHVFSRFYTTNSTVYFVTLILN